MAFFTLPPNKNKIGTKVVKCRTPPKRDNVCLDCVVGGRDLHSNGTVMGVSGDETQRKGYPPKLNINK